MFQSLITFQLGFKLILSVMYFKFQPMLREAQSWKRIHVSFEYINGIIIIQFYLFSISYVKFVILQLTLKLAVKIAMYELGNTLWICDEFRYYLQCTRKWRISFTRNCLQLNRAEGNNLPKWRFVFLCSARYRLSFFSFSSFVVKLI